MGLARWPDQGFVRIAAPGAVDPAGDGHGGRLGKLEGGFHYEGDRPSRWKSFQDVWVHGYWAWDWANNLVGEDPGFTDRARLDFSLKDGSPAYRAGFKRIPFEAIGLERDEYRPGPLPGR